MTNTVISTLVSTGVTLDSGNYGPVLTVINGGTVLSGGIGVNALHSSDSLDNTGSIHGGQIGVYMLSGSVTNGKVLFGSTGIISGGTTGVEIKYGTLSNGGTIIGTALGVGAEGAFINNYGSISGAGAGVTLYNGGNFDNGNGAYVSGTTLGLLLQNSSGLIFGGQITGGKTGVVLAASGTLTDTFGTIHGSTYGMLLESSTAGVVFDNLVGAVTGARDGVVMQGGTVDNGGGYISGGTDGIYLSASAYAASIFNASEILGGAYAIDAVDSFALTLSTGASFSGHVRDRSNNGLLVLNGHGALSGLGNSFAGFSTIDFLAGATWTLQGNSAALASHQTFNGFTFGDTLELTGFAATSDTLTAGALILGNGVTHETVSLSGNFLPEAVSIATIGLNTVIDLVAPTVPVSIVSNPLPNGLNMNESYVAQTVTVTNTGTVENSISGASSSTLLNYGSITADVANVPLLSNLGGDINSASIAVSMPGVASVLNSGLIDGQSVGILANAFNALFGTDQITNSGTIIGGGDGIEGYDVNLFTSGLISGGSQAIYSSSLSGSNPGAYTAHITVAAGAAFSGAVQDASRYGTLILGGSTSGSLDIGTSFSGFSNISFASGTDWTLEGAINDLGGGDTITGFTAGDTIILDGFDAISTGANAGTLSLLGTGNEGQAVLILGSAAGDITVTTNAVTNATVLTAAPCFCAGTRIATSRGNVAVEALVVGDMVRTATHGYQPIRWIGRRAYEGRFIAGNHQAQPVKIRRHALGFNVPSRDLYVSPDHAMCESGVLVHAWRLVNGVSVTQAQAVARVEYFHIALARHEVIFAENAPTESFWDADCVNRFANAAAAPVDLPQAACLKLVEDGYYLARLKQRIDARAGITPCAVTGPLRGCIDEAGARLRGWAQDEAAPEQPVELEVLCDGVVLARLLANRYRADLRKARLGSGCHAFDAVLPLHGVVTLRRVADGAILGARRAEAA